MAKRTAKKTANSGVRFDDKRTRLKTDEIQRKNGTYEYRWTTRDGKRHSVYAPTLDKLREYEEQVIGDCGRKVGPLQGEKQMYSYEERLRAVKLYIKYDHSLSAVIRELGYPSHQALLQWYREYITQGDLHAECVRHRRRCKFTMEQRKAAVAYYQEQGQNLARTVKKLGYPSRATLFNWLKEDIGRATHPCHSGAPTAGSKRTGCNRSLHSRILG